MNRKQEKIFKKPKTKLRFAEILGEHSIVQLAQKMNVTYTQLYPYKKDGANPTLLALEELAAGLSALLNKEITINDLIDNKKSKKTYKSLK